MKVQINQELSIDDSELNFEFVRVSGPGGQKVNKVATGVDLIFDLLNSPSLPEEVKIRVEERAGTKLTQEGILRIKARRYRTQAQNREDVVARLVKLIRKAAEKPKIRKKSRPSKAAKAKRLQKKKRRGEIKRLRQRPDSEAD